MAGEPIPFLNEHEGVPQENSGPSRSTGYQPTESEKKTIKMVNKCFDRAKKHRSKYEEKWGDYYKFFRGQQWKEKRPSYRHSEVVNLVFQSIQSTVPIMTDSRPKFEFSPQGPEDRPLSEILNKVSEFDWIRNGWLNTVTEVIYEGHIYGTGLSGMTFNPKGDRGLGAIEFDSCDPFYCFPDKKSTDVNKKGKYFIYAEPTEIGDIKKRFPENGKFVRPDIQEFNQLDKTNLGEIKYKTPDDNTGAITGETPRQQEDDSEAVLICLYIQDDEILEEEQRAEDGSVSYNQKLKYPNGRKVVVANGILLSDGPNPYEDGQAPYSRFQNYILPREFWGISDIEQSEGPQKIFNKLFCFALDVMTLMGNPIWIVDDSSGIDTENLINRPGLVVNKTPGSEIRRESGVQLQPFVLDLADRMKVWFDEIQGANDVTRGVRPSGISAGVAIRELQDAAQTRIRQKSRNLDTYLQTVGQQYKSRVFQFYTQPRMIKLTNPQGGEEQFFKFHIENQMSETGEQVLNEDGTPKRVAKVRDYIQNDLGQYSAGEEVSLEINGDFDIKVVTGSSLPFDKAEKEGKLLAWYKEKLIDRQEVLKGSDYPNWEEVLARMNEAEALAAQAQMAPQMPV